MKIYYDDKADLLYLRIDERERQVENRRLTDEIVLDVGEDDKIAGIEILDASKHVSFKESCLRVMKCSTKMNVFSWALSCSP